jgi:two-component system sporulation sensor kinase A
MNYDTRPVNASPLFGSEEVEHSLSELTFQWFEQSSFGAAIMNLDCHFMSANPAFCGMLGYNEEQLKQTRLPSIVHPDELLRCMHLSSQLATGTIPSFQLEQRFTHQSGPPIWCSVSSTLLRDENGDPQYILLQTQNIDEKKKESAALHESVTFLSSLLEAVPFALVMLNREWFFTYVNRAAEQLFKFINAPLLGLKLWELFPQGNALFKELSRSMDEKAVTSIHHYYKLLDKWYEINCYPTKDGISLIIRETTHHKQQEKAYKETKLRLDSMIEHAPDAICILDLQHRVTQVNPAYVKAFGFSEGELLGERPPILPEELYMETQELFLQAARGKQIAGFETQRRHKDGRLLDVNLTISPVINSDKQLAALCVIIRNITDSKRMESELRQIEERYRIITENTHDLIMIVDADGMVQYASPSHKMLGVDPDTLVGKPLTSKWEEPTKTQTEHYFFGMVASKEPKKTEIFWPDLVQDRILEVYGVPVIGADGRADTVVIVSRDISERKNTEELLRRSDKLLVAGQLAAGIAHEIRNPLTALKGFTQLMLTGGQHKEQYLTIMKSELTRIEQIISELLMLAKPQAVTYKKRSLEPIIYDVISLLESQANLSGVQIMLNLPSTLPMVHCEENQLKQIFINVIKNGMEAMPKGGLIQIDAYTEDPGQVVLVFQDQGSGMPAEKLSRLGEPFFTTKEKGSGLGLMISQKIINEHGGFMHFSSEPGQGTTVTVLLPAALDGPAVLEEPVSTYTQPDRPVL